MPRDGSSGRAQIGAYFICDQMRRLMEVTDGGRTLFEVEGVAYERAPAVLLATLTPEDRETLAALLGRIDANAAGLWGSAFEADRNPLYRET